MSIEQDVEGAKSREHRLGQLASFMIVAESLRGCWIGNRGCETPEIPRTHPSSLSSIDMHAAFQKIGMRQDSESDRHILCGGTKVQCSPMYEYTKGAHT